MARFLTLLAFSLLLVICGCGKTYKVEMSVEGGNMNRSTIVSLAGSQPTTADVGPVADGIGATSTLAHYPTSVGQAWIYIERIRGNDAPAEILKSRFESADKLADLLLDWAAKRYSKQKEYDKLRQFIDRDLRQDMKNISAYEFVAHAARRMSGNGDTVSSDLPARLTLYLLEHDYLKKDDLPFLYNAIVPIPDSRKEVWLNIAGRLLRNKVGLTDEAFIADILADPTPGDPKSFNKCLRTNPAFQTAPKKAASDNATSQPADYEPASYAMELAGNISGRLIESVIPAVMFFGSLNADRVEMALAVQGGVTITNGAYDEKAKKIQWSHQVDSQSASATAFPTMQYAVWAQPDEKFQRQHFGQVIIADAALTQYCLWRNGLPADEGKKWDAFLATIQPATLANKVATYADALKQANPPTNPDADITMRYFGLKLLLDYLADKGEDK